MIMDIFKKKGDRYVINGVEIAISDNHHTKPYIIEVKQKSGRTGRANLKMFVHFLRYVDFACFLRKWLLFCMLFHGLKDYCMKINR